MRDLRTRTIYIFFFCLYIAALCYLCFARPDGVPSIEINFFGIPIDKVVHFLMFLPFPFLAFKAFESENLKNGRHIILFLGITAAGAALATLTEFIQGYLTYRSEDTYDLLSDYMGLSTGVVVLIIYLIFRRLR
jgi:VanZ family protein